VAELVLSARSPLHDLAVPRRCGAHRDQPPGVTVSARPDLAIARVVAGKGKLTQTQDALFSLARVRPNDRPGAVGADGVLLIGCAPGQWLALAEGSRAGGFVSALGTACAGIATVTDQTSAKVIVRVSGPRVRDALAKGCPIDLHEIGRASCRERV